MGNNNVVFLRKKTTETQHAFSIHNKEHIAKSQFCGCFNCCTVFRASDVSTYCFTEDDFNDGGNLIDESAIETTGECPNCGSSAVLPDSVVDVTPRLIMTMCDEWESDEEEEGDIDGNIVDQDPDGACDNCAEAYGTEPCIDCENYDGDTDTDPDTDDNEEEDPED